MKQVQLAIIGGGPAGLAAAIAARESGVQPEECTVFDDSIAACRGARSAKMRVVGVYDSFFAQDERQMREFCDVYIRSFEELLWLPEQKLRKR